MALMGILTMYIYESCILSCIQGETDDIENVCFQYLIKLFATLMIIFNLSFRLGIQNFLINLIIPFINQSVDCPRLFHLLTF